ncbi:MAG: hypothetical protein FJ145_26225 [Deltaproteobacteria bacterium]|nr:hypothetical protein [Deltaproteobacteria bacterium]
MIEEILLGVVSALGADLSSPRNDQWAPAALTIEKLWHAAWPIGAGALLAWLIARLLPGPAHAPQHGQAEIHQPISLAAKLLGHMHPVLLGGERLLRQSAVSGAVLLLSVLVLCWLLALS